MKIVLISTYELGRQPFGLASPAAWLRKREHSVSCFDLTRQSLNESAVRDAELIAIYLPMHTATRLAARLIPSLRESNANAHLCCYGLYAPMNVEYLQELGVETILGGEFESGLAHLAGRLNGTSGHSLASLGQNLQLVIPSEARNPGRGSDFTEANVFAGDSSAKNGPRNDNAAPSRNARGIESNSSHNLTEQAEPIVSLQRLSFETPDRAGLPAPEKYAHLLVPGERYRITGSTEASRGCKHLCRHCPIVPVYNGVFRIVARDVVMADVRQQVAAGAQHISFGDPDFFNGIRHALDLVRDFHAEFPDTTYDVTIKIEHLRQYEQHLETLRSTGCLFVTTAVESVDNEVLGVLDKGHTREDFLHVVRVFRSPGMALHPTFIPFTPWTTFESYLDLLHTLYEQDLIENVAPIQLGIRLLIPGGSRILELPQIQRVIAQFDRESLTYPWKNDDPRVDELGETVQAIAADADRKKQTRFQAFERIWQAAHAAAEKAAPELALTSPQTAVPILSEPWYCCAEPTEDQFISIGAFAKKPPQPEPIGADNFV
jgi:radical SAM superfamily enzyme YgiQ (UPF0313 family)